MCTIVRLFSRYTFQVFLSACFPGGGVLGGEDEAQEGRMEVDAI